MERKNTMLLTVIAVATLLVAVVGATFAYFTASSDGAVSSTVTVTTEQTSTSTASSLAASIYITAAEMEQDLGEVTYTAATSANANDADGHATMTTTNGSTTNSYVCTYDVVYAGGTYSGSADDIKLIVTPSVTGTSSTEIAATSTDTAAQTLAFNTLTDGQKLVDGATFTVPANTENATLKYTVALTVTNTAADQTADLAGEVISGSVTIDNIVCGY